jgi:hypothetical protein
MHSISPYSVRVHNVQLPGPLNERYHHLDDIRGKGLLELIAEFTEELSKAYVLVDEDKSKRTLKLTDVTITGREIYGYAESGHVGIHGKVIDVKSGTTMYKKTVNDADISQLYFHFVVPQGTTVAVCAFHNIHGRGIKSIFEKLLNDHFRKATKGLVMNIKPVTYLKAVEEWMKNSNVKELRLEQYTPKELFTDPADQLQEHVSQLIIKPKKKGTDLGNFWDFHKNEQHEGKYRGAIELMYESCKSVKAVVEFENRKRVFSLSINSSPISAVDFDESDVTIVDGAPELSSLKSFTSSLLDDLIKST